MQKETHLNTENHPELIFVYRPFRSHWGSFGGVGGNPFDGLSAVQLPGCAGEAKTAPKQAKQSVEPLVPRAPLPPRTRKRNQERFSEFQEAKRLAAEDINVNAAPGSSSSSAGGGPAL